jgi:hypothetical protein
MPPDAAKHNSGAGAAAKGAWTFLGAALGAVWGAIVGARQATVVAKELVDYQDNTGVASVPEAQVHPFMAEHRFPPRPAPDWLDPKPAKLPKPSYAPATLAFGVMLAAAGDVTSFWVSVAGLILFVLALANWIGDLLHEHK